MEDERTPNFFGLLFFQFNSSGIDSALFFKKNQKTAVLALGHKTRLRIIGFL